MSPDPLAVLSRIRSAPRPAAVRAGERCELCAVEVGDLHGHVVDLDERALRCVCRPCYLLFTPGGAGGTRLRAVPERCCSFPAVALSPAQWDSLQIPVSVAFFFLNSRLDRLAAFYPSPAGATESLLALETWAGLVADHPDLSILQPDVEALLVRADRSGSPEVLLVPIDLCYELVGRLRTTWRGFDGGTEAHAAIEDLFAAARARATPVGVSPP